MIRKGRQQQGESKPDAKLTEAQVIEARARFQRGGISRRQLAKDYGVAPTTMHGILHRTMWKHVA